MNLLRLIMFKYALIFLMLAAFSISTSKSIIFRTEQNVDISKIEKKYSTTGKKIISAELLNTLNKSNVLLGKDKAKYYLEKLMSYSVININDLEANILNELEAIAGVIQADYNRKFSVCKSPKDILPDVNKLWNMEQIKIKKAWKNSTGKGIIISLIDTVLP